MEVLTDAGSAETYKQILKQNGIQDEVKEVQIRTPNMVGDQFASQCKNVTVEFSDESRPPLQLFVKVAAVNREYADLMKDVLMFEKEALYFSSLLPEMKKFVESTPGYDGFLEGLVPKCYYASDDFIVLENLQANRFMLLKKRVPHDLHTAELVVKTLAKFHAVALAFLENIGQENFVSKYSLILARSVWSEEGEIVNGTWIQNPVDGAIKILTSKPTPGSDKALEYFKKFENRGFLRLCDQWRLSNQSCSVCLNHGDLWNGNLMFKVNSETKMPETCTLIDLQTVHLGSPAFDLAFYLFTAVDSKIRYNNWNNLLHTYYDHLKAMVQKLGTEVKFSFQDLVSDCCSKCETGFFFGLYHVFGWEALENVEDVVNSDGNAMDNLSQAMSSNLDRLMEQRGKTFSENIVKAFEEFLDISSGKLV